MTPDERKHADILDGSRRKRVAKGSGTTVEDVNRLLKQFVEMQRMKMVGQMTGEPIAAAPKKKKKSLRFVPWISFGNARSAATRRRKRVTCCRFVCVGPVRRSARSSGWSSQARSKKEGEFIEVLGFYNPAPSRRSSRSTRSIAHWIKNGARPSDSVRTLLADTCTKIAPSSTRR